MNVMDGCVDKVRRYVPIAERKTDWIKLAGRQSVYDGLKRTRLFSLVRATHKDSRYHARSEFSQRHRSADRVCGEGC
jgi:hypothetical protein